MQQTMMTPAIGFSVETMAAALALNTVGMFDVVRLAVEYSLYPMSSEDIENGHWDIATRIASALDELIGNDYFSTCPVPEYCTCTGVEALEYSDDIVEQFSSAIFKALAERHHTRMVRCDNCTARDEWSYMAATIFSDTMTELLSGEIPKMITSVLPHYFSPPHGDKIAVDYLGSTLFKAYGIYKLRV